MQGKLPAFCRIVLIDFLLFIRFASPLRLKGMFLVGLLITSTTTATRSCRTGKRAFHYSPGVVRRSHHTAALHVRLAAATGSCAAAAVAAQLPQLL